MPIALAHTHVHSIRLADGAEALVARLLDIEGRTGFGFAFTLDASRARLMALSDLAAKRRGLSFAALAGGPYRRTVPLVWTGAWPGERIDPFEASPEAILARCARLTDPGLIAPGAHAWELAYCAMLAAATPAPKVAVLVPRKPRRALAEVPGLPGLGIPWRDEPGFARTGW